MRVYTLRPQLAVQALNKRVVRRLAGPREVQCYPALVGNKERGGYTIALPMTASNFPNRSIPLPVTPAGSIFSLPERMVEVIRLSLSEGIRLVLRVVAIRNDRRDARFGTCSPVGVRVRLCQ